MRKIELKREKLSFSDEVLGFLERVVTPFGNSAKVDCPRKFVGMKAYLIIVK